MVEEVGYPILSLKVIFTDFEITCKDICEALYSNESQTGSRNAQYNNKEGEFKL